MNRLTSNVLLAALMAQQGACTTEAGPEVAAAPVAVTIRSRLADGSQRVVAVRGAAGAATLSGTVTTERNGMSSVEPVTLAASVATLPTHLAERNGAAVLADGETTLAVQRVHRAPGHIALSFVDAEGGMVDYEVDGEVPHIWVQIGAVLLGVAAVAYCSYTTRQLIDKCAAERKDWRWEIGLSGRICEGQCVAPR